MSADEWTVVHDFAFHWGGAERVTGQFTRALDGCALQVVAGDPHLVSRMSHRSTALRIFGDAVNERNYRHLIPAYLAAAEVRPPISGNVLASSYGFAHLFRATGSKVVYCHSPLRQAWSGLRDYTSHMNRLSALGWERVMTPAFRWVDKRAADGASKYVATSRVVQNRIHAYYGLRDVPIIAPPVDPAFTLRAAPRSDFFLFVGRIVEPYKRLGLLLEAMAQLPNYRLVVVGEGRDRDQLTRIATSNVEFRGELATAELSSMYAGARGVIFPSEDDFGMVVTESIACGTPVLAFGAGGAVENIDEGRTGMFFSELSVTSLVSAFRRFADEDWNHGDIARQGERWSAVRFREEIRSVLV